MNKVIKNILHHWYLYILAGVASTAVVIMTTSAVNRPINEETISIFVGSCGSSNNKLYKKLLEEKPSYLRQIKINSAVYYSSDFGYLYTAFGKSESDLIIIPESIVEDEVVKYYYTPLDESYMNSMLGEVTYYTPNDMDKPYGVLIRTKGDTSNDLITYSKDTYDENYYAFLYRKSFHAGENNKVEHDASIKFINIIKNYK